MGQPAGRWLRTFGDEFDSAGGLNRRHWNDVIWYGEHTDPAAGPHVETVPRVLNYDVNHAGNSCLRIWPALNRNRRFFNRTIDTDGKFEQRYGFFEARMKMPRGRGPWPAFWLTNHADRRPLRPEIDILECYPGGGPDAWWSDRANRPTTYGVTFWTDDGPPADKRDDARKRHGPVMHNLHAKRGLLLDAGFHVYGLRWDRGGRFTWYFDGDRIGSHDFDPLDRLDTHALYLVFDLWWGSASGEASLDERITPQGPGNAFEIDYVRVWQAA